MYKHFQVFRIVGRRTFFVFGIFAFLCVSVIAATHVVSRHALKQYVEDQLRRIEWDIRIHQGREIPTGPDILRKLREFPQVRRAESLMFLRSHLPPGARAQADETPVQMPWFVVLSATDPALLPPEYRTEAGRTVLAFFGMRSGVQYYTERLQGAKNFSFLVQGDSKDQHPLGADHDRQESPSDASTSYRPLISLPISQIAQLDREVLNRWFLEHTGTVSYVPFVGAALNIGNDPELVARFDSLFSFEIAQHEHESSNDPGHEERAEYIPEVTHVVAIDRRALVSGWKLDDSYRRLAALRTSMAEALPWEAELNVRSDTEILLGKMKDSAALIDWVTFLLAFPLVIMAWVFAANLVRFVFLNERRTVGLMRLRGLSGSVLNQVVLSAVLLGGLLGGVAGLLVGTVAPLAAYEGFRAVPALINVQRPLLAVLFLCVGLVIALIIGRRLALDMGRLAPGEAVCRFSPTSSKEAMVNFTLLPRCALVLGGYKFLTWWTGSSVLDSRPLLQPINVLLDFIAVPLLIYGLAVLVASRKNLVLSAIHWMNPLCLGRLKGLAVEEVSNKTARVSGMFLVGSLSVATVLAPSIASHSFADKALRGAKVHMGADAQVRFNPLDIAGQPQENVPAEIHRIQGDFDRVLAELRSQPGVESATGLIKALIPMYLPGYGYNGVPMFLLMEPERYLKQTYSEESLGIDQPFSEILKKVENGGVAVSPAVADFWRVRAGDRLVIGVDKDDQPITVVVAGILNALPGAPQRAVTDRDGFVTALSDYLNYLFAQEAFIVASANNPALSRQTGLVPQMVALVRSSSDLGPLPRLTLPARGVDTLSEQLTRVKQDMFIFLVGENLKIYVVGGFVLALSAIIAIFLVNYWEGRRTFALLRVRGSAPADLIGLLSLQLYAPLIWSLLVGGLVGAIAGYGVAHRLWGSQRVLTVINQLPTHFVLSFWDPIIVAGMLGLLSALVVLLGFQVFRRSPQEAIVSQ